MEDGAAVMRPAAPASEEPVLDLADEEATRRLAGEIAAVLAAGDMVTLSGDLGSGKTTFARALIRHLAGDETLEVPSPTFTLMQTYDLPRGPVVHVDLYRVNSPEELIEMGFADLVEDAVVLVEWPDRAHSLLPADRLDVAFAPVAARGESWRRALLAGRGAFADRLARMTMIGAFLREAGYADAARTPIKGDASTRAYERLTLGRRHVILMNAPRRPDGPPVRDGLPYSRLVHLAEDDRQ